LSLMRRPRDAAMASGHQATEGADGNS
jgi:hypothetical protein